MSEHSVAGKAVLVTGGSAGIGFAIAQSLLAKGARVAINGRDNDRGQAALAMLSGVTAEPDTNRHVYFVAGDVGIKETAVAVVNQAAALLGKLDIVISAGAEGAARPKPFCEMSLDEVEFGFSSRFFARMFPIHAAIPHLREAGGGSIVFITTDAARHPTPGESIIGASGAAIMLVNKALAGELARYGIRVNALALTLTSDTPSYDRIFSKPSFENKLFSKALTRFPFGRAPKADEIATAALFLVSDDAAQITGQTISINGGLSFGGW